MEESEFSELSKRLSAQLEINPYVNTHHCSISIRNGDGKVFLEGTVNDIGAKRSAAHTALKVCGDRYMLVDRLRVVPGEEKDDRDLRDEIIDALGKEPVFSDSTLRTRVRGRVEIVHDAGEEAPVIEAAIHQGAVVLHGRVASLTHRRLAEVLVWWTSGCQTVDNRLEVDPPEADNDNELIDAVRMALEKDPLVHADRLAIGAAGGVVELGGFVHSDEEKRLAIRDAWYIPGVWDVVDRIETRV